MASAVALANDAGSAPTDAATIEALRAFEQRVHRIHARNAARVEEIPTQVEPPVPEQTVSETPPESAPAPAAAPRLRLRSVLDRASVSSRWQVEQDSWRAGIRLRYSRSVEFDPATESFALDEALSITPTVRFRIVALGRTTKAIVRRTGYETWDDALFGAPSRWLFVDRPNRAEEAQQLAPGTVVTLSNETKLFVGPDDATDIGTFPMRFRAGTFASGESFARLERLPEGAEESGDREWIVSVGGLISRGLESSMDLKTPDLLGGKNLRLLDGRWRSPTGVRFFLRAGPLDIPGNPAAAVFLRTAMDGGASFRFFDLSLLGANVKPAARPSDVGSTLLRSLERFPNVTHLLDVASMDPDGIPSTESISRFTPRASSEAGFGLWAFLYGLNLSSEWFAEESLVAGSNQPASLIFSYPMQRRWDRGWLFFPRETQDIQMITLLDGQGENLITELSLEIEDAHAHRREGRVYRGQVLSFMTRTIAEKFPQRTETVPPDGPRELREELPELAAAPEDDERVSIYLRLILGPRFHERLLDGAMDAKSRRERITEWQKRLSRTIRKRGDVIEELVRTYGAEDLFVSFRIALTPHARRKESPRPTSLYIGSFGDPDKVPTYRQLRDAFDAAGATY